MFSSTAWFSIFCWVPLQLLIILNFKEISSMTINKSYNPAHLDSNNTDIVNPTVDVPVTSSPYTAEDELSHHHLSETDAESLMILSGYNIINETTSSSETLELFDDIITRNNTYVACNISADTVSSGQYEGDPKAVIESRIRELDILNNTNREVFENLTIEMSKVIDSDDEVAEQNVITITQEYTLSQNNIMKEINTLNAFIRNYKCTSGKEHETMEEVLEQEYQEQFHASEGIIKEYKYLKNIINIYDSSELLINEANNLATEYSERHHISDLRHEVEKKRKLNQKLEEIVQEIKLYRKFAQDQQEYFVSEFFDDLLNLEHWQNELVNKTSELKDLEQYVREESFRVVLQEYVQPTFQGVIFVIGFVGNVVLLLIFARHKDLRTTANMMLLNLALADTLNLVINIVAFYTYFMSSEWTLGEGLCIVYRFLRQLCIGVSVYSVAVISIQKFLAVTRFIRPGRYFCLMLKKFETLLTTFSVWFIGSMIAIPHTINAGIYEYNCYGASEEHTSYPKAISMFDFIALCMIPFVIITCLSGVTAAKIKQSIQKIPGEKIGMEDLKHARTVSSNILIALTFTFAVSYFPFYLFMLIFAWYNHNMNTSLYHFMFFVTYTLSFGNSCFNPIALYISSTKFRNYFNMYLFCRRENTNQDQIKSPLRSVSSNVETG